VIKKPKIGIMSGRLSKPKNNTIQCFPDTWESEFTLAKECGFNSIEWIFDLEPNPILDLKGRNLMKDLSEKNEIEINSICCDYFMIRKLFGISSNELEKNLDVLTKIIVACENIGIKKIEIPLVDTSSLKTNVDKSQFTNNIKKIIPLLPYDTEIILETDLNPNDFKIFLENFDSDKIKANYDIGNSTSLEYSTKEEFESYGKHISNIHVKDRFFQGKTVPLGTGDVNFDLFFSEIKKLNYSNELIIQGARQDQIKKPLMICKEYLNFVNQYLDKYYI
jgi:L-ribulose-5-phosphate 3-epimerase